MKNFGNRLQQARKKNISQEKLAELLGIVSGKATVSGWENERARPKADDLSTTIKYLRDLGLLTDHTQLDQFPEL